MEYYTCAKCKIQQKKENFWYGKMLHEVCKFCNKKTNIVPNKYEITTEQILDYLNKIVYDQESNTSIYFQTQILEVQNFLLRQKCKEEEINSV